MVAYLWSIVIYGLAVKTTTGLKWPHIVIAMIAPLAVVALIIMLMAAALSASLLRLFT
jgi:hypothetical protein